MWHRRLRSGERRVDGILAQTQDDQVLYAEDDWRQPEDAVVAQCLVERAAEKIGCRHTPRPDDVVDADVFRKLVIADTVAHEGFDAGQVKHIIAIQPTYASKAVRSEG